MSSAARQRLFVKRFLGEDISSLGLEDAMRKIKEAEAVREFEVGVLIEAMGKMFGG